MLLYISVFILGFYAGHYITVLFPKSITCIFATIWVGYVIYLIYIAETLYKIN